MSKESKIMACVDGSEGSIKAAWRAYDFAKKLNREIIFLNVNHTPFSLSTSPVLLKENYNKNFNQIKELLAPLIDDARKNNITYNILIKKTDSSVVERILDISEDENVDMIFVGKKGKSALQRIMIGSVANGLMTNSKCSVYISR